MKRAVAWLFAAACCVVLALALPRPSALVHAAARAPSASLVPARDAGPALVRSAPAILVVAPAPDPVPPVVPARRSAAIDPSPYRALEETRLATTGAGVLVVRWQRHIPRMDSGEPPRQGALAS